MLDMPPDLPHDFELSPRTLRIEIGDDALDTFEEDGLYVLTFAEVNRILPEAVGQPWKGIRLFCGPADTLDQAPSRSPVGHRLREVPMAVHDDGDGVFDAGDSVVFWGQGTSRWKALGPTGPGHPEAYRFQTHPFGFTQAYFLDLASRLGGKPARPAALLADAEPMRAPRTQAWNLLRAQRDRVSSFCDSHRADSAAGWIWFWHWRNDCGTSTLPPQSFEISEWSRPHLKTLPEANDDSLYVIFDSPQTSAFWDKTPQLQVRLESPEADAEMSATEHDATFRRGRSLLTRFALDSGSSPAVAQGFSLRLAWSGGGGGLSGYDVRYRREVAKASPPFMLFPGAENPDGDSIVAWSLPSAAGAFAVAVVEGLGLAWQKLPASGVLRANRLDGADHVVQVTPRLRRLEPGQAKALASLPEGMGVKPGEAPDYLVVAPQALAAGALKLAAYRRTHAGGGHQVAVLPIEWIQDRYAGGRAEPAALRDFLQWAAQAWGDPEGGGRGSLRDVLLLGDGHFDVRNVTRKVSESQPNFISPFILPAGNQTLTAEDRFGYFGDSLTLNIGRLPMATSAEVDDYLAKARAYDDPRQGGAWRGRLLWAADDAYQFGGPKGGLELNMNHTGDIEAVYRSVSAMSSQWHHAKILMAAYPENRVHRKPEAAQDLVDQWNRGSLAITYFGHGAPNQWADEVLAYTFETMPRLRNAGRLPVVSSFACTVGRFENGLRDVFTENLVRLRENGAIAGVAATRETHPQDNVALAKGFYAGLFRADSLGGGLSVGEALRRAKNRIGSQGLGDAASYALLGEPVLQVAWRGLRVKLDAPVADTLGALHCGTLTGSVATEGALGGASQGHVQVTLRAGPSPKSWRFAYGPDAQGDSAESVLNAELPGKVLFSGGAAYAQGRFRIEYVLPLQIPFGDSLALLQVQAFDTTDARMGAQVQFPLRLDGVAKAGACPMQDDGRGPRITLAGCDTREMQVADLPSPLPITLPYCLVLRVTDSLGGVHSGELPDEGTVVSVPGVVEPFHPLPSLDEPLRKEYSLRFAPSQLPPGEHDLLVQAGDAYGHRSTRAWRLQVRRDTLQTLLAAFNVPNPVRRSGTVFHFAASVPADDGEYAVDPQIRRMRFHLRIYDQLGRMVADFPGIEEPRWHWDGRDAFGRKLANGVYAYTVSGRFDPGDGSPPKSLSAKRNVLVISR